MILRTIFIVQGIATLAAGLALFIAPELIPGSVGIDVPPSAYLVCYLLGAAELGLAFLSFAATGLTDGRAVRVVAATFIVFHLTTVVAELLALSQGSSTAIWGNVAVRIAVIALLAYFGLYRTPRPGELRVSPG